ncbi:MAG: NYN domain-containing protein [Desulfobulbus propionicus]|nr:MAG: NYN domain-containing protein [Desulfobulbus propionicus]
MLKTGIYVDAENIKMSGGFGMRYDVLVNMANGPHSQMLRANCYLAEDRERISKDPEYQLRIYTYHDILRNCGFKVIKKVVRRFHDEDGNITYKANSDMDLAIDALLQARNLDRVILVSGDGDFIRLVTALQNNGCRVEVVGFENVSSKLREAADTFTSGFLIPGLLPIPSTRDEADTWQRGTVINFNQERGFGFFRYYRLDKGSLFPETVFFHLSSSTLGSDRPFADSRRIFEFRLANNPANDNRPEARDIRLMKNE